MGLHDFSFYDLLNRNAVGFNGKAAWYEADDDRTFTFSQVKDRVDHLAYGLREAGIRKGDRIGILGKNNFEYFLLFGAAAALGAIIVPINRRLSADEVLFNLNDGEPRFLFVGSESREVIDTIRDRLTSVENYYSLDSDPGDPPNLNSKTDHLGDFPDLNSKTDHPGDFPDLNSKTDHPGDSPDLNSKTDHPGDSPDLNSKTNNPGDFLDFNSLINNPGDFQPEDISSNDGFVIIHTAAVAGRPRGALLSQTNLLLGDMHFQSLFHLGPHDVHLNFLPLFHVGGLFMAITSFHAGALNVNMSGFDVARAVDLIEEKKVSILMEFSPMLSSILEQQEKTGRDISSLMSVAGLDSPETIEKYQKATGGVFYCLYGQTEVSCVATYGTYNEKPGSAGRMIPLAHVMVVDDYDHPVPQGRTGEIIVRGPMVFKGYWNLPEDTQYAFREGWHHTGDLGRFDEDGYLWYKGRKPEKELIKPGGENVYPAEVEKVLLEHPAILASVVFGVPDPKWKEGIKAVCKLKEGEDLEAETLIDFVGERIARFKKPQYVEFVTNLPLLEDGTPDRNAIKELYGGPQ